MSKFIKIVVVLGFAAGLTLAADKENTTEIAGEDHTVLHVAAARPAG
ncbi:hypothetical protein [Porphyrobacter sp. LM 6]|nr:hypothetical protein [Porphyrobacter sp. LM 6]AOL95451.1 hypothetical protein BG023_112540 [Porphyrobacter sp. LM 6]